MQNENGSKFAGIIKNFLNRIEGLQDTFPLIAFENVKVLGVIRKEMDDFVAKHAKGKKRADDGSIKFTVSMKEHLSFTRLEKKVMRLSKANEIVPQSFIVTLVSQYDGLLGDLLRAIYKENPEKLNTSQKPIIFSQLKDFKDIDEAIDYIVEQEVESFLRDSHIEQIKQLEKKLEIPLRKGLSILPKFIEICERRNLFVHTKGIISRNYLEKCKKGECLDKTLNIGDYLHVSPEYFEHAYEVFTEMAIKLSFVIWSKILPDDRKSANATLNEICYDLIFSEKYKLAISILDFAVNTLKPYSSQSSKLMFKINLAQSYKWNGDLEKCTELLESEEWSVLDVRFRLSNFVLSGEFAEACIIMKKIGQDGAIKKDFYKEWPLFKEFVVSDCFKKTYKDIFQEDYDQITEEYPVHVNIDDDVE